MSDILAALAEAERLHRIGKAPAAVAERIIGEADAANEIAAWGCIRQHFAGECPTLGGLTWSDLVGVAERACAGAAEIAAAHPSDRARQSRWILLRRMTARLGNRRDSIAWINEQIRSGAAHAA